MENASKALMMAGGMLIAVMVISLLVLFFNNIREWQGIDESGEELEQIVEFNKQYEVYARNVYGSELLSIANKVADYNKRQAEAKGYVPIEVQVTISKGKELDTTFFKNGTYNSLSIKKETEDLEAKVKEIGEKRINSKEYSTISRKISQLAGMRTTDKEELGFKKEDYEDLERQYNTYKSLLTRVKETIFRHKTFEYDEKNGRITKMIYEL